MDTTAKSETSSTVEMSKCAMANKILLKLKQMDTNMKNKTSSTVERSNCTMANVIQEYTGSRGARVESV